MKGPPLGVHVLDIGQKSAVWAGMSAYALISSASPPVGDIPGAVDDFAC